jgi:glycosyltransferase involved in cell wall biosynthesis
MSVLVFDDASDGDTFDLLRQWNHAGHNGCVRGTVKSYGTGKARNSAIHYSEKCFGRGDYLYLSDNDVFFHPAWLETLIACYGIAEASGIKVLGAYNHPFHQPVKKLPCSGA